MMREAVRKYNEGGRARESERTFFVHSVVDDQISS